MEQTTIFIKSLFLGLCYAPAFYYNTVQRFLDYLNIPQKITFMQYMKDNMQMRQDEQEVATTSLGVSLTHVLLKVAHR